MSTENQTLETTAPVAAQDSEAFNLADYRASRGAPAETKTEETEAETSDAAPAPEAPAQDETAPESETEDASNESNEAEPADGKPKKNRNGFKRRIERLLEENKQLSAQLAGVKPAAAAGETATEAPAPPPAPQFGKPKPKLEDFESLETFTESLSDWKADERDWKRAESDRIAKQQNEGKQLLDRWNQGKVAVQAKYPDFDAALDAVRDIQLSPAHQRAIFESEHGPELAYQLAKDPEELERIASLSPLAAARALGVLEARLASDSAPSRKPAARVSAAPQPIRPLGGTAPVAAVDVSTSDFKAYKAARQSGRLR